LAGQITPGINFEVSNLSYTPFLSSIFDGSSTTSYECIGKEDGQLQVGSVKVRRADETLVVLLLSNKSAQTLTDITTTVQVPEHFSFELQADPLIRIPPDTKTFSLSALPPSKTALEVIRMKHKKLGFNLAVIAQVQYTSEGQRTIVSDCNVFVEISDLLRPHDITIDAVGKVWHAHSHESKAKFTPATPVTSSSALLARFKTELSVHTVQVIRNEGIGAASLLNSELLLLMHVLVLPQSVDITVRSKDKSFTEVVMRYLHKLML
jgi:Adaptin AP4 complex epsilon appendage platform/Adaptin C-terminal domain